MLDRIDLDRPCYACMLVGPDKVDELVQAKTGQVLTARVDVPHAGWP